MRKRLLNATRIGLRSLLLLILFMSIIFTCSNIALAQTKTPQIKSPTPNSFCDVELVKVIDGDTIRVNIKDVPPLFGENLGIRFKGINVPEKHCDEQAYLIAYRIVSGILSTSKRICLKNCERGTFSRLVCEVYYDSNPINELLLRIGVASPFKKGRTNTKKCVK